ncbi:DUF1800 domain-containing protein [Nocardioides sp. GY 10127]|uniref:DUF1800 domain-containing protein n=1 Tax=Nocardioides sp. GY 10127 TaxID=2569762 RepID=UPI0014581739|nr:DUF1800 domain-containing protein [Nocardioides sp. GY 10127]
MTASPATHVETDTQVETRPGRRRVLRAAGGGAVATAAAAAGVLGQAGAAEAAVRRWKATPVPKKADRHVLNRFTYGITTDLARSVRRTGARAWFEAQVKAAQASDGSTSVDAWFPDLRRTPAEVYLRETTGVRSVFTVAQDYACRALSRRVASPLQVLEVMTEFWENHLHVPVTADNMGYVRAGYGDAIRAHALGRFEDMLQLTTVHPAMLMYLGNNVSTQWHPNENLGRELLELHTVGIGNHTEDDIKAAARVLTGWTFSWGVFETVFRPDWHSNGPATVCGLTLSNSLTTGRSAISELITHLAHHPATARRIATKLVMTFVDADDVPEALVQRLADAYLEADTAIVPVLRVLLDSPEFKSSVDGRLRDADDGVVAAYRVLGVELRKPTSEASAARQLRYQAASLGLQPFGWPRPDGQPLDNRSWATPTRALASMTLHWQMATRTWPVVDVRHRTPAQLVPADRLRLDQLVDHLSRLLLARPATRTLLKACQDATGLAAAETVYLGHPVLMRTWPQLVVAILDSPASYYH